MGKNGTLRLLRDCAAKNKEIPSGSLSVFLVRVRECQGQVVPRWPPGAACWGRMGETPVPLQSLLCSLEAHYFGKLQEKLGLTLPELKCLMR